MKKLLLTVGILLAVALVACGETEDYETQIYPASSYSEYWYGLQISVAKDSVTPTGLQLVMSNASTYNYFSHGTPFFVERYRNGIWLPVPFETREPSWSWILIGVPPSTATKEEVDWQHIHGELPTGRYRIVRNFILGNWDKMHGNLPHRNLYVEFLISSL